MQGQQAGLAENGHQCIACHLDCFCWSTSDMTSYTPNNGRCANYNIVHRHVYPEGPGALFKMNSYAFEQSLHLCVGGRLALSGLRCRGEQERWQQHKRLLREQSQKRGRLGRVVIPPLTTNWKRDHPLMGRHCSVRKIRR